MMPSTLVTETCARSESPGGGETVDKMDGRVLSASGQLKGSSDAPGGWSAGSENLRERSLSAAR
jgi:hypothetical protein